MSDFLTNVKKYTTAAIAIVALILSVLTAINDALPKEAPPIVVSNQGVSNLDTLQVGDGSLTEPAFGFTSDTNTGMYRVGSDNLGLVVGGSNVVNVTSSGASVAGTFSPSSISTTGNITAAGNITATGGITSVGGFVGDVTGDVTGDLTGIVTATTLSASSTASLNGGAAITGSLTISGFTQYPFVFFGSESAVNGTMIAHGRGATLTYPWCMVYDAAWVTATARISATNTTSVTLAIFGTDGEPWTDPPVPVRCGAVYVP